MNDMLQRILVAADTYRGDVYTYQHAIALAEKLHASLRMMYVVRFKDLRVLAPGPPTGGMTKRVLRGTVKESRLVEEGREELDAFSGACERASIEHSGEVFVGPAATLWAEEARSCDLAMIRVVEDDFGRFERWFGSMFWTMAARSCRPVLIFRRDGWPAHGMVLFYSNHVGSARALPWVVALCSALGMPLTVYVGKETSRNYSRDEECQDFLNHHRILARFENKGALNVLYREANQPDSQLDRPSLLVFDRGFYGGLWFHRPRRLVERLIRSSRHSALLCP
jgi:hypothetical protein